MNEVANCILNDAKEILKESLKIENKIIEDKILSIMANAKIMSNQLEKSKDEKKDKKKKSKKELEELEVKKVMRKVPMWLKKPNQYNYKILKTFMNLSNNNKYPISIISLERHSNIIDPKQFISHYNQMKGISEKNHAKVFNENKGEVRLWKPVEEFITELFT